MPRKIVQIAAANDGGHNAFLWALCNDGSLWVLDAGWNRMEAIPQDGYQEPDAPNDAGIQAQRILT